MAPAEPRLQHKLLAWLMGGKMLLWAVLAGTVVMAALCALVGWALLQVLKRLTLRQLPVRLAVNCQSSAGAASAELLLGDQALFYPSNAALAGWKMQAVDGKSEVVYE